MLLCWLGSCLNSQQELNTLHHTVVMAAHMCTQLTSQRTHSSVILIARTVDI